MFDNIKKMIFGNTNSNSNGNPLANLFGMRNNRSASRSLFKLVTFETAKELIDNEKVVLIDVRTPKEYNIMHIQGATNIPVDEIEARIFTIEQSKNLMVYCSSGSRSRTAIQILNNLGYNNIYIWEYSALATFPYKDMLVYGKDE